jgi:hypothetical protein
VLTWFIHFHKAGGTTVVALARRNGEELHSPNLNGCPLSPDRKVLRLWERSPQGLNAYLDGAIAAGVTFVASEWGVPDLEVLAQRSDVRVVTVIRDPIKRIISNFRFDRKYGYSERPSLAAWVDQPLKTHTFSNYYTRMLARNEWRDDASADEMVAAAWRNLARVDHIVSMDQSDWVVTLCKRLGWHPYEVHENRTNLAIGDNSRLRAKHLRHGRLDLFAQTFRRRQPDDREVQALTLANQMDIRLCEQLQSASREIRLVGEQRSASKPRRTTVYRA